MDRGSDGTPPRLRASHFDDFVIVAEFSEIDGPILSLLEGVQPTSFNLNDFVTRIMSVDYQVLWLGGFTVGV